MIRGFFRLLGSTIKWTLIVFALLVVIVVVVAIIKISHSVRNDTTATTKPTKVSDRVVGSSRARVVLAAVGTSRRRS